MPEERERLSVVHGHLPAISGCDHRVRRVLSVRQGSTARAVPIAQSHGYRILSLAIGVLRANDPALSPTDVLALADAALAPLAAP